MNKKITFRHLEKTPDLEAHIHHELAHIENFLSHEKSPINIELIVEAHKIHAHNSVEIRIKSPNYTIIVKRERPDLIATINEVLHIAYAELGKAHEQRTNKHTQHNAHDPHRPE